MIDKLGSSVQGSSSSKENDKGIIRVTDKEVGSFNPFKVKKDSEFKGNDNKWSGLSFWLTKATNVAGRLDKRPDQENNMNIPCLKSKTG
eukprot:5652483-Heterocapsa_arctica.AAC.1